MSILCFVIYVHFRNFIYKSKGEAWTQGYAGEHLFNLSQYTTFVGEYIGEFPLLANTLTQIWYIALGMSIFILLSKGYLRTALLLPLVFGHLMIGLTMTFAIFPLVSIIGLVLFVPSVIWNRLEQHINTEFSFDGVLSELQNLDNPYSLPEFGRFRKVVYTVALVVVVIVSLVTLPAVNMFAPAVPTHTEYYVFSAETQQGQHLDLINDRNLTYKRPHENLANQHETARYRMYLPHRTSFSEGQTKHLTRYICEKHPSITHINIWLIQNERTGTVLRKHGCGKHEPKTIQEPESVIKKEFVPIP